MTDFKDTLQNCMGNTGELAKISPDFFKANDELTKIAYASETLDMKTKELIFLSFAIAKQCESCIAVHVSKYIEAGGDRESLAELANLSILMDGGPGMVYSGKVLEAFDQLSQ
ncbi:carboxymuconolactone decarboxylase family protein [Facklamia sp. DSM 111018]|uniref:Carboxymuconolactone decarboxylase family protein n=1 Tax=Facklamia lactis TaxID=2749967 RepID=A0ABS0LSD7_9LACT|nr:carboxymuconolactone decarboxylase family protein [Facklamia lactis]MBG9981166.1 carboxymuconolactone decarboxylase family protein [Facklamia lactis]MBG9986967.1 carboxymuconolactone decarboxylase family protein [Facklamia lactis]